MPPLFSVNISQKLWLQRTTSIYIRMYCISYLTLLKGFNLVFRNFVANFYKFSFVVGTEVHEICFKTFQHYFPEVKTTTCVYMCINSCLLFIQYFLLTCLFRNNIPFSITLVYYKLSIHNHNNFPIIDAQFHPEYNQHFLNINTYVTL